MMTIGEVAKKSGISAKMIRYYERIELVPPARRSYAGYRLYSQDDVHRLHFIRRARDLGFSMAEIKELLSLWSDTGRRSADVKRLSSAHLRDLQQRIDQLQELADTLQALVDRCAGDQRPDCPILTRLAEKSSDVTAHKGTGTAHEQGSGGVTHQ